MRKCYLSSAVSFIYDFALHRKLGQGAAGEECTLYSLRHTAIMYRLWFGGCINTLLLARNALTSVEMIDRFYVKPLEWGNEH